MYNHCSIPVFVFESMDLSRSTGCSGMQKKCLVLATQLFMAATVPELLNNVTGVFDRLDDLRDVRGS